MIVVALLFLGLFLALPLLVVFVQALAKGVSTYIVAISDPVAWSAIKLTLLVANWSAPCPRVSVFAVSATKSLLAPGGDFVRSVSGRDVASSRRTIGAADSPVIIRPIWTMLSNSAAAAVS